MEKNIVKGSVVLWTEITYGAKKGKVYFSGVVDEDYYDFNNVHWLVIQVNGKKVRKKARTVYVDAKINNAHLSMKHIWLETQRKHVESGRDQVDFSRKILDIAYIL